MISIDAFIGYLHAGEVGEERRRLGFFLMFKF